MLFYIRYLFCVLKQNHGLSYTWKICVLKWDDVYLKKNGFFLVFQKICNLNPTWIRLNITRDLSSILVHFVQVVSTFKIRDNVWLFGTQCFVLLWTKSYEFWTWNENTLHLDWRFYIFVSEYELNVRVLI